MKQSCHCIWHHLPSISKGYFSNDTKVTTDLSGGCSKHPALCGPDEFLEMLAGWLNREKQGEFRRHHMTFFPKKGGKAQGG